MGDKTDSRHFETVYADHAATTPMHPKVLETMTQMLENMYGNPSSLHCQGQQAKRMLIRSREMIASCIEAHPREITFTSGGSEAINQALRTAAYLGASKGKHHVVASRIEHHAVLNTLKLLEKMNCRVTFLDVPANGIVRPQDVAAAIREDTALVCVMHANNEIGTLQPVEEIGQMCREKQVLLLVDAVQSVGHIPVSVRDISASFLVFSAHKFGGPKGAGVLYTRAGIEPVPLIAGGGQERGLRAGTENLPAIAGMARALEIAVDEMTVNQKRVTALRDRLIAGLETIPQNVLNGDRQSRLPGIANFFFPGVDAETLLILLDNDGISASSGAACSAGAAMPSHVLTAIGLTPQQARSSLRFSLGPENTAEEMEYIVTRVKTHVETLRKRS
ncbi:MAG: cysteine desulfurase [Deltaproteobacteria bacterium]|nr:cysteine desulfurase [Deltaproteobacteria bacterium]